MVDVLLDFADPSLLIVVGAWCFVAEMFPVLVVVFFFPVLCDIEGETVVSMAIFLASS